MQDMTKPTQADIRLDEIFDDYFAQPRETVGLAALETYFEQNPKDNIAHPKDKGYVTIVFQAGQPQARRSSVPVAELPNFMRIEMLRRNFTPQPQISPAPVAAKAESAKPAIRRPRLKSSPQFA
jgi:hypothetical protein